MANRIRILSESTINQIAAGEVVEGPSSVVKELIENALDAGATEIRVQVREGGRQLIRVMDDGCGMSADDALLALERHATSKIRKAEDLVGIATMGFRGEALAAIAAVSKLTLITAENGIGVRVMAEGGRLLRQESAARPRGTTIEVRSLFFNTPVRRNFQKSVSHDLRAIMREVTLAALAHLDCAFTLESADETVIHVGKASELKERAKELLGSENARWFSIDKAVDGLRAFGLLSAPFDSRPSRSGQYLFVNRRPVESRQVANAIREGYATALPNGRYPSFVLHLEIPGEAVDVNVHPQKREVRLGQEEKLKILLIEGVAAALTPPSFHEKGPGELNEACASRAAPSFLRVASYETRPRGNAVQSVRDEVVAYQVRADVREQLVDLDVPILGLYRNYILLDGLFTPPEWADGEPGLLLLDGQGAASRLLFDRLLQQVADERIVSEPLLIPITVELSRDEFSLLTESQEAFSALGLEARPFGGCTAMIDAVPAPLLAKDVGEALHSLLASVGRTEPAAVKRGWIERAALGLTRQLTHGQTIGSIQEAKRIVQGLIEKKAAPFSPTGEALILRLGLEELERRFRHGHTRAN